jgi:HSP20 family molecular chaperone IbpA
MFTTNALGFNRLLQDIADELIRETPSIREVNKGNLLKAERFPDTDICLDEEMNILHVEVAAPGFSGEDFDIYVEDDMLVIKGTISEEMINDDEEMKYFQKQISKKSFVRKIKLRPEFAQSEHISAKTENGILTVSIEAVKDTEQKVKKIKVH